MGEMRKLVTDNMGKAAPPFVPPPPPDLPPELRRKVDAAKNALASAKTASERKAAERQASKVKRELEEHLVTIKADAAIKLALLKPKSFF
jgi:hypothetical protein